MKDITGKSLDLLSPRLGASRLRDEVQVLPVQREKEWVPPGGRLSASGRS